jgi:ubiquinone/menaquinone biosynthesis C-methylase UbiE
LKEKHVGPLNLAIDVGCGSGQATKQLSNYFNSVYGFDISENQIKQTMDLEKTFKNLKFFVSPSECLNLSDSSVDFASRQRFFLIFSTLTKKCLKKLQKKIKY